MVRKITIIGEFKFPQGDAASTRVLGIGKMLRDKGYLVSFIGKSWEKNNESVNGNYCSFSFYNVLVKEHSILRKLYCLIIAGFKARSILKEKIGNTDLIIYYGNSLRYLIPFLRYRRKKGIKLVADVVEWYDYSHVSGGRLGPVALDNSICMTKIIPRCDGVIAISSYLSNYYQSKGVKTVRIPQVVDLHDSKWNIDLDIKNTFDPQNLNLVYAGVPGKKDLINVAAQGIYDLLNNGVKVKLHLLGPSDSQKEYLFRKDSLLIESLGDSVFFHGKIPQEKVPYYLAKGDFSILIRPDRRYANAGFATKFVESFAVGLPVIANLTSDMGLYLKDNRNGLIMKDASVNSFVNTVKKAALLTKEEKMEMKAASKLEANRSFDYRNYNDIIDNFVKSL